ncbi:MAG: class I SAM-dependent methyltransferase [Proteobacteria bacterium]|nr:class I SAM-dependent methyltransferase [Pseudomonadota bacterium]
MITQSVISELLARHASQLDELITLFHRWNQKINLSAARTIDEIREHVRDSIHVVPLLAGSARVLDVGSGGGFPVLIAAICLPTSTFISLEPVHKKHAFLRTATRELGLPLEARAERLEQHAVHDYDAAMSRATFDLAEWLTRGRAHVRPGGIVIGFEGERRDDLVDVERHSYTLANKQRALIITRT